jgi:hypothetical protein
MVDKSNNGYSEQLPTEIDMVTVSKYLSGRYALRFHLGIYGGVSLLLTFTIICSLVGAISIDGFPKSISAKDVILSGVVICVVTMLAIFGIKVFWFPSPVLILIAAVVALIIGVIGFFIVLWSGIMPNPVYVAVMPVSALLLFSAWDLYRVYEFISNTFRYKPDSKTNQSLSLIRNQLLAAAFNDTYSSSVIRFKQLTSGISGGIRWVGKLYPNGIFFA